MLVGVVVAVGEDGGVAEGVSVLVAVAVAVEDGVKDGEGVNVRVPVAVGVEEGVKDGEGVRLRVVVAMVVGEAEGVALRVPGVDEAAGVNVLVAVMGRGGRVSVGMDGTAGWVSRGVMVGQRICEKAVGEGVFLGATGCVEVSTGVNPPGAVGEGKADTPATVGEGVPRERAPKVRER